MLYAECLKVLKTVGDIYTKNKGAFFFGGFKVRGVVVWGLKFWVSTLVSKFWG